MLTPMVSPSDATVTQSEHVPLVEGVNMGTYVGFKHVAYVLQSGIYAHLRYNGIGVQLLYAEFGVLFELIGMKVQLRAGMLLDDTVLVTVEPNHDEQTRLLSFRCVATVIRQGKRTVVASGEFTARLTRFSIDPRFTTRQDLPQSIIAWIHENSFLDEECTAPPAIGEKYLGVRWSQRLGYIYGHYFKPIHVDAYLRVLEDAKDRFMVKIGCPLEQIAATDGLVPMVTRFDLQLQGIADMGVTATIDYQVTGLTKRLLYDSAFKAWESLEDGRIRSLVTGNIQHGYALLHDGYKAHLTDLPTPLLNKLGVI